MKYVSLILLGSIVLFGSRYEGSTTAAVSLVGGVIKSTHIDQSDKKYKRKDCPVCKGTGKYLSGDSIKMVDCGYCEPDKKTGITLSKEEVITHPPIILYQNPQPKCTGPNCPNPTHRIYRR